MKNDKNSEDLKAEYLALKSENDLAESKLFNISVLYLIITDLSQRLDEMPKILSEKHKDATKENVEKITRVFQASFSEIIDVVKKSVH